MSAYWSLHTHSRYSAKDALAKPADLVATAAQLGYPALGLTDHGNPAGLVQFYLACRKAGISPLPGEELYVTVDHADKTPSSMHLTIAAYTEAGWRNLVALNTLAHRNYYRRPRLDFADLAALAHDGYTAGLLVGTGCRSSPVVKTLMTRGLPAAKQIVDALAGWFPRCYVEVMNHGFTAEEWSDDEICQGLDALAATCGLPVIVTGDAHYCLPEHQALHNAMKELVPENPLETPFNGEGYHLVDERWLARYLEPRQLAAGLASLAELAEVASVRIPELDTFTARVPDVTIGGDPMRELSDRVWQTAEQFGVRVGRKTVPLVQSPEHVERVNAELAVIGASDYAGYLLLVASITDEMTRRAIWFWTRGSATGALTLYVLGITQVDPLIEGIRMERFLSGDRSSLPDIDLDIDAERRDEMIAWVADRFYVRQVASYSTWGLEADDEEQKGSLKVAYWKAQKVRAGDDVDERIPEADWARLSALAPLELVNHTGTHAAGFLVADSQADLDRIPLVRIREGSQLVTAFDKDDIELFGMPKIDLLGSKTITAVRVACQLLAPDDPRGFWDAIPRNDQRALRRVASGETAGMFQLSGYSQRKASAEMKPVSTDEIIAMQALYRTAVSREFQQRYLARRAGAEAVPAMHPDLAVELAPTYGIALYQEQMVGILRNIGMPVDELNRMLKAVKASGKAGLVKARQAVDAALPGVEALARARGFTDENLEQLAQVLTEYGGGYSFGKAHSVLYGLVAYRTAWLATHQPLAFWTGMLTAYTKHKDTVRKRDVEAAHRRAARAVGLSVRKPHVNISAVDYRAEADGTIRTGLYSVPYVGRDAAAELVEHAPYRSLRDLGQRVAPGKVTGAKDLARGVPLAELLYATQVVDGVEKAVEKTTVIAQLAHAGALSGLEEGAPVGQPEDHEQFAFEEASA